MACDPQDASRFKNSPFKPLKGLSVSGAPAGRPAPPAVERPPAGDDDGELFAREMAGLEVRRLTAAGRAAEPGAAADRACALPESPADDGGEFLAALGTLDRTFRDELPAAEPPPARPRRMRQLERGQLAPSAVLDLHGLGRDEALARTRAFLGHAARQGWPLVLVVTGKGLHSQDGPVLRRAVEQLLAEARDLVMEWGAAPRRLGGSGALAVFVRRAR